MNRELQRWISDQVDMADAEAVSRTQSQLIYKYLVLRQMDLKTHYSRLTLPGRCDFQVPIQPGLFKGTYSAHGLELVLLSYEDKNKVTAVKITVRYRLLSVHHLSIKVLILIFFFYQGDPNVPASKVTFRADLPYCMHLNEEAQKSFERIQEIEAASSELDWSELPSAQPFLVPEDCEERYPNIPKHCRARFHLQQICRHHNCSIKTNPCVFLATDSMALDRWPSKDFEILPSSRDTGLFSMKISSDSCG